MIRNKRMISRFVTLIAVLILTGLGVKAIEINKVIKQIDKQIFETEKVLSEDKARVEELKKERENMDTPEYIEKVAREKLGMVKADDIVFKEK